MTPLTPEEASQRRLQVNRKTLHVLLVLSFINTGSWILFHLGLCISSDTMREAIMQTYRTMAEQNQAFESALIMMEQFFAVPQWYYLLCVLLEAASVAGMILMWRVRKNGFHCYALSKLLLILLPLLFLDRSYVAVGDIMIALFFIVYYFFLLKALGAFVASTPEKVDPPEAE